MHALLHDLPDDPTAHGDRRSAPRVRVEADITLASESQFFTGLTADLSGGGVFVATYRVLPLGCPVAMQLALPDGDLLARGTVRWLRGASSDGAPGLGIAFDGLDPIARLRVECFCQTRAPLLYEEG
jgi:uncharacterized protein (TIGR02266 family)